MDDIKTNENIENLFTKLFLDKSLAEKFSKCKTPDEFYDFCISVEKGYTKEELIEAIDMLGNIPWDDILEQEKKEELNDNDLENVAGGVGGETIKKSIAGFLGLLTIGTSGVLVRPNANATGPETGVSKTGIVKKIKSKIDKMPKYLKYALYAAGTYIVARTAINFSRRYIIPNMFGEKNVDINGKNVIGLSNPRNACYINASLQQLYSASDFRIRIMRSRSSDKKIKALQTIFKSMDDGKSLDETTQNNVLETLGYRGTQESAYDFLTFNNYIGDVLERLGLSVDANPLNPAEYNSVQDYFDNRENCTAPSLRRDQIILPFVQRPSDIGKSDFKAPQEVDVLGSTKHLTGAIVKTGSGYSGHYTSYKKMADGKWYHFNDSYIKEVSRQEVEKNISKNATVLVYSS